MVVDELLEEIVKNNAVNYLVDAGNKFLGKIKDKKTLKNCLLITVDFLSNMNQMQIR